MTKEEYKREFVRMMDSMRDESIGEPNCHGVHCDDCPFNEKVCNSPSRVGRIFLAFDVIEIVENWSREHPSIGGMIKSLFSNAGITEFADYIRVKLSVGEQTYYVDINKELWNAPYKGGKE